MQQRGTIVYVHGASDRAAQVDDHVARIERQLALAGMAFDVLPARWGERAGARLDRIEDALPAPESPAAVRLALPELPARPLDELERIALAGGVAAEGTGSVSLDRAGRRDADQLLEICRIEIGAPGDVLDLDDGRTEPLAVACRNAAAQVAGSVAYNRARLATVDEAELVAGTARAVAATVASETAAPRDVLVDVQLRIAEAVLGAAAATLLASYLGIDVGPGLRRWATDVLLPHRARIMRDAALGPADVLVYQRDGAAIRQVVADTLLAARARGGPVVALGNSLGGIVLVGTLAERASPRPDLLVTLGTQASLLATFNALQQDGRHTPVFEPWLNIYDRRDLLGFVAARVWPEQAGIIDRQVDMGVGFPDSHGASYLSHADVYRHIGEHPALAGEDGGASQPAPARRFAIRLGSRSRRLLRAFFGVQPDNAFVTLDDAVEARFGWFSLRTPLSNVESWRIEGPWSWLTAIGVRRSLRHGDVTFGGSHEGGVRLQFRERLRWLIFRVPALYVTVEDLDGFAAVLSARGIPGSDARERR